MKSKYFAYCTCLLLVGVFVEFNSAVSIKSDLREWEWCDEDGILGCLNITDAWYTTTRPFNLRPQSKGFINTRFYLHTRTHPAENENVEISAYDKTTIETSTFDPKKQTKFICHGFIDTGNRVWLKEMAQAFLTYGDYNVIRVNWGGGSLPPYTQATANTRVVGLEIGHLVNTLAKDYGLNPSDVHILGHSLGSHISGYAGEQIKGLGRITGMDPAGPYYTGTPPFVRLDPTDAEFVEAIHTDADSILLLGYGTGQPMGSVDIFVNGGHSQPGCDPVNIGIDVITDIGEGGRELAACNHDRSHRFVTDSLKNTACNYLAHECFDYESFKKGDCGVCGDDNRKCAFVGERGIEYPFKSRQNVRMFLDTGKDEPFCLNHYRVTIDAANPNKAEKWVMGHLLFTIYGSNGNILNDVKVTEEHARITHGQQTHFLFTHEMNIETVIRIEAKWVYDDNVLNPGTYCWTLLCNRSLYINSIQISPINYYPEEKRISHTKDLCSQSGDMSEIKDGHTVQFVPGSQCNPISTS